MTTTRIPMHPIAQAINAHYEGLATDRLLVTRCGACSRAQFPPRVVCYGCGTAGEFEWFEAAGTGVVWSYVTFHKAYFPPEKRQVPYDVAVVQLDEGPLLVTNLVDVPDDVRSIGLRVRARFSHEDGQHLVLFEQADATPSA